MFFSLSLSLTFCPPLAHSFFHTRHIHPHTHMERSKQAQNAMQRPLACLKQLQWNPLETPCLGVGPSKSHLPYKKSLTGTAATTAAQYCQHTKWGAGLAQWLECRTRDQKVAGLSPGRSAGRVFFSGVNFLC